MYGTLIQINPILLMCSIVRASLKIGDRGFRRTVLEMSKALRAPKRTAEREMKKLRAVSVSHARAATDTDTGKCIEGIDLYED